MTNAQLRDLIVSPIGIRVLINNFICQEVKRIQYRFPQSRKRRIRKKWAKQPKNFKAKVFYKAILIGNTLYVHQKMADSLKNQARTKLEKTQ